PDGSFFYENRGWYTAQLSVRFPVEHHVQPYWQSANYQSKNPPEFYAEVHVEKTHQKSPDPVPGSRCLWGHLQHQVQYRLVRVANLVAESAHVPDGQHESSAQAHVFVKSVPWLNLY